MRRLPLAAIAAAALWLVPAGIAEAATVHERDQRGVTAADFSYQASNGQYSDLRLGVARAGAQLVDGPIPTVCGGCEVPAGFGSPSVHVRDLDGDGEPEVILDLYTGGAHCCVYSDVFRFDPQAGHYVRVRHDWGNVVFSGGNGGYRLRDLHSDGRLEFVAKDDRFAYVFTDYADSFFPIRIWSFRGGAFVKVTRSYRSTVARDARSLLGWYHRYKRQRRDVRGALAAYTGDMYLLHRPQTAWRQLRAANRRGELRGFGGPTGSHYLSALRRFLRRSGY